MPCEAISSETGYIRAALSPRGYLDVCRHNVQREKANINRDEGDGENQDLESSNHFWNIQDAKTAKETISGGEHRRTAALYLTPY
jgi:hypothetical protein